MSEQVLTMAGTRIFIGASTMAAKLEVEPSDFASVTWIEIGGLYNVGELGGDQTINEFELINSDWMQKTKSTRNGGTMANQFIPMALDPGQQQVLEAIEDNCGLYPIKVERGADCSPEATVTIADGTPGVVTWTGSAFTAGQPVTFTAGDGATLPAELSEGVVYYVLSDGLTADSFSVAETPGGTAIEIAAASTGEITAVAPPAGLTDMFQALVTDGVRSGGAKNDAFLRTFNFAVNGRVITV